MGSGHGTAYTEHSATDIILEFYSSSLAELQFMDLGDTSGQRCHCRVVVFDAGVGHYAQAGLVLDGDMFYEYIEYTAMNKWSLIITLLLRCVAWPLWSSCRLSKAQLALFSGTNPVDMSPHASLR